MNLKTTIALFILALGAGLLVWKGPDLAPRVGLAPKPLPEAKGTSAQALQAIVPGEITSITVNVPNAQPLQFAAAAAGKPLELPGNWPTRRNEVEELIATLSSIKSRFQPVPLELDEKQQPLLKPFGLAASQEPLVVKLVAKGGSHTLTFGETPAVPGENPFTRPAYVRVDEQMEVIRLGPDVMPVLRRGAEVYRKRQLFPDNARLKVAEHSRLVGDAAPQFLAGDGVVEIAVQTPQGRYVLKRTGPTPKAQPPVDKPTGDPVLLAARIADVWEIVEPVSDRADPVKLKAVLAAIPELWVEQFLVNVDPLASLMNALPDGFGASPLVAASRLAVAGAIAHDFAQEDGAAKRRGLVADKSDKDSTLPRTIVVKGAQGTPRTLVLGKTTKTSTRTEAPPPPPFPMAPPQPPKIIEEKWYYGKLADNPLIFEVKGEKVSDLFLDKKSEDPMMPPIPGASTVPMYAQLRDPNAARFEPESVLAVTVARPGQTLELRKTKGDPKAESEAAKKDRWDLVQPFAGLAEARQVTDLLEPLERLSAKPGEVIDRPVLHALVGSLGAADVLVAGLTADTATTITITSDLKSEFAVRTLRMGAHDAVGKKLFVMGQGASRINVVDDAAHTLVDRQPRAYRALKLFDLGDNRVESIVVQLEKSRFRLQESVGKTTTYTLTEPVQAETDTEKSRNLLKDLGSLEAIEYAYDPPGEAETNAIRILLGGLGLDVLKVATSSHGLDKPSGTVTIQFTGPKPMPPRTLSIGKLRDGKPEYFARLDGSPSVFSIKKEVAEALTGGSLALLPLQLWNGDATGLSTVQVQRGADAPYTLKQEGPNWKVTAPFEAAADAGATLPLATALAAMKAEKYAAHTAANPAEFGFDKPALRLKFTLTERKVNKPGDPETEVTKERTLVVGKQADGQPGRYAHLEGDANPAVFVLAAPAFTDLDKSALELLNKRLLSVPPPTVVKLELTGPDGPLTLQKEGNDWKPVGATFPVDKPTVDSLLRIFSNLNALKFADYGDAIDWAKYGLDANAKPPTITVVGGPIPHKLELGKTVEGTPNDRYARVDGGKAVAVLPITLTRDLSKGKLDLVDRTIFKFDPIDLQAIRRTMGTQEFEATLTGTNWEVTKPTKLAADQENLEELGGRLGGLRAERVADVEGKDLAKYGLDKPAAILKLELIGKGAKSVEKSMKIGAPVDAMKPDGERYAQPEGATTVVVLGAAISKKLLAEPIKFRERNLASFVTADKLVVTRNGKDVTFVKTGGNWKLKEPLETDAEDEALRELHDALARLRGEEIVIEKATDLKPYGLDKADRWRLFNGDKEVLNLLVGSREKVGEPGKQKDGFRAYAKLEKGDLVVLLDMSLTAKLSAEYRKRALWEPLDVATATTIEVDTPDGPGSFKLLKGPIGWMDLQAPGDRMSTETVTDFLDAFAGLKAERFVEHAATDGGKLYGLDPARKTVTVTTQSGQKRTILLGRVDESKRVYAKAPGKDRQEVVLLSELDTAKINKDRAGFLAAAPAEKKELEPKKEVDLKKEPPKAEPKLELKKK